MKSILRNRTAIEEWIEEKANYRLSDSGSKEKFKFPYDLGWKRNFLEVFSWNRLIGNGFYWNIREDCHQYTLTVSIFSMK